MQIEQQDETIGEDRARFSVGRAKAFRLRLSVFPASFTAAQAARVCHEPKATDYLEAMHLLGLVRAEETEEATRYALPQNVREAWRGRLSRRSRHRLAWRFARLCAAEAEACMRRLRDAPEESETLRTRTERERTNWEAALDWTLIQSKYSELAARLLCAAAPLWCAWSDTGQARKWYERLMNEPFAPPLQMWHSLCLHTGNMALDAGDYRGASRWFRVALEWAQSAKHTSNECVALEALGVALHHEERDGEARKAFHRARRLHRLNGNRAGEARTLGALGDAYLAQGRTNLAQMCFAVSLRLWRQERNKKETAGALFRLGEAQHRLGNIRTARCALRCSMGIRERIGDLVGIADCLLLLATLAVEQGEAKQGQEQIERAIYLYGLTGRHESRAAAQAGLSRAYLAQNCIEQAEKCAMEGLRFWQAKQHSQWTGIFLVCSAEIACQRGAFSEAKQFCEQALQTCAGRRGSLACCEAHFILGRAAERSGETAQALSAYQHALEGYGKMAHRRGIEASRAALHGLQTPPAEAVREERNGYAATALRMALGWRGLLQMPLWGRR